MCKLTPRLAVWVMRDATKEWFDNLDVSLPMAALITLHIEIQCVSPVGMTCLRRCSGTLASSVSSLEKVFRPASAVAAAHKPGLCFHLLERFIWMSNYGFEFTQRNFLSVLPKLPSFLGFLCVSHCSPSFDAPCSPSSRLRVDSCEGHPLLFAGAPASLLPALCSRWLLMFPELQAVRHGQSNISTTPL